MPGKRAHRFFDASEDVVARQHVVEAEAFERVLRPRRFQPPDRDGDALRAAFRKQLAQVLRAKYLVPAEGLNKVQGKPFLVSEIEAAIEKALS